MLGAIFGTRTKDPRSAPGGTFGQTRTPSSSQRETRRRGFKDVTSESPRERYSGHSGHIAAPAPRPRAAAREESEGTRDRRVLEEQKKRVREHEERAKRQSIRATEGRVKRDAQASRADPIDLCQPLEKSSTATAVAGSR